MRSRRGLIFALAALLALSVAADAVALRKPTHSERRGAAKVVGLTAHCATVRISTVTTEPKWASVYWRPGPSSCKQFARNGVAIVRKRAGGNWRFVSAGSSYDCPSLYRDVPQAVAEDLKIDCF